MHFNTFEELKNYVLSISNEKEKTRINEELSLFKERNWETYVLFVVNFLQEANERTPFLYNGSVYDSYLIRKAIYSNTNQSFLDYEKGKNVLFNDSLKINISIVWINEQMIADSLNALEDVLSKNLTQFGLKRREKILEVNDDRKTGRQLLVISDSSITDYDMNIILNEKQDSTPEEAEVLRRNVIVRIQTRFGL